MAGTTTTVKQEKIYIPRHQQGMIEGMINKFGKEMEYHWQTIRGVVPSKANQYKVITLHGHGSLAKQKGLKEYEDKFYMQVGEYRNLNIKGLFEFHCRVYYPSMRSDIDNSLKVILDCLQKTNTIDNDNKCVKVVAEKFVDKENPRIEFKIITIE